MKCVFDSQISIIWYGNCLEPFKASRGLRQGDPLSPYLFALCMEKLSHLILDSVNQKKWRGLKTSRYGPTISHLFYADDLILFSKAESRDCRAVMDVLNYFCYISGQKVNILKSKCFISKNVPRDRICMIKDATGIPRGGCTHILWVSRDTAEFFFLHYFPLNFFIFYFSPFLVTPLK